MGKQEMAEVKPFHGGDRTKEDGESGDDGGFTKY